MLISFKALDRNTILIYNRFQIGHSCPFVCKRYPKRFAAVRVSLIFFVLTQEFGDRLDCLDLSKRKPPRSPEAVKIVVIWQASNSPASLGSPLSSHRRVDVDVLFHLR